MGLRFMRNFARLAWCAMCIVYVGEEANVVCICARSPYELLSWVFVNYQKKDAGEDRLIKAVITYEP